MTAPVLPIAVRVDEAGRLVGVGTSSIYELLRDEEVEAGKWGWTTLVVREGLLR